MVKVVSCLLLPGRCSGSRAACHGQPARVKLRLLEAYGFSCYCCGEADPHFLCLDHRNNDGSAHRASMQGPLKHTSPRGGWPFWSKLLKLPLDPTLGILCYNCNNAKQQYGRCPHTSLGTEPALGYTEEVASYAEIRETGMVEGHVS